MRSFGYRGHAPATLRLALIALAIGAVATVASPSPAQERSNSGNPAKSRKPKFTISKPTTFLTTPLTAEGYVDYTRAINEMASDGVTPQNNAAVLYWRALGPRHNGATANPKIFEQLGMKPPAAKGRYFISYREFLNQRGLAQEPNAQRHLEIAQKKPWTRKQFPRVAQWLDANTAPLDLCLRATTRPRYYQPIIGDKDGGLLAASLPVAGGLRNVAKALIARAMLRLGEGKSDRAWSDLHGLHRLARQLGQGPSLIQGLVSYSIENLAIGGHVKLLQQEKLTAKQAKAYLDALQGLSAAPTLVRQFDRVERFTFLDTVMSVGRGNAKRLLGPNAGLEKALRQQVDFDFVLRAGNRWYDKLARIAAEDDYIKVLKLQQDFRDDLKALEARSKGSILKNIFTKDAASKYVADLMVAIMLPSSDGALQARQVARQNMSNLTVALALAAHRSAHGRYPKKLADLVPAQLKSLPKDSFTGKPLRYKLFDDGYLLYSVGRNLQDDDGTPATDSRSRQDDLVVRIVE